MLSIRMQRTGRKGHASYRVVVQDSRQAPTSGKFVALLGSYDPHTKTTTLVKDEAERFLSNGAQPSDRVVRLLTKEGVKMPAWVKQPFEQKREIGNPDKLRRNRPPEEKIEEPAAEADAAPVEVPAAEEAAAAEPEVMAEVPVEEAEASHVEEKAPAETETEAPAAEESSEESEAEKPAVKA